jgi:hypothetical protein
MALGSNVADNTASASFKIVPTKKRIDPKLKAAVDSRLYKFRRFRKKARLVFDPKLIRERAILNKPTVFIENNPFRIDTRGELKGITARAFLKKNKKKLFRKSNNILKGVLN